MFCASCDEPGRRAVNAPDLETIVTHGLCTGCGLCASLAGRDRLSVFEVEIPEGFSEQKLADLGLPRPSMLVAVASDDRVYVPGADTTLSGGDRVTVVTTLENEKALRDALRRGSGEPE